MRWGYTLETRCGIEAFNRPCQGGGEAPPVGLPCPQNEICRVQGETVYILDDDPVILEELRELVEWCGYTVKCFSSPLEFQREPVASLQGCVMLDVELPGVDGIEMHTWLRSVAPNLPVIFLSGVSSIETAVSCMRAGAHAAHRRLDARNAGQEDDRQVRRDGAQPRVHLDAVNARKLDVEHDAALKTGDGLALEFKRAAEAFDGVAAPFDQLAQLFEDYRVIIENVDGFALHAADFVLRARQADGRSLTAPLARTIERLDPAAGFERVAPTHIFPRPQQRKFPRSTIA